MKNLNELFQTYQNQLDYDTIHHDKHVQELIYSNIHITCEQSPFDYIEFISLEDDGRAFASVFVEPIGTVGFSGESLERLFEGINTLFNSQPTSMDYAVAGHKVRYYATHVRKCFGIDVRYLNTDLLWQLDFNEEPTAAIKHEEVITGRDLFHYVKQKNRVPIGILDGITFMNEGVEETMMGEIIYAEEVMPDFLKVLIDLSRFEAYNQSILTKYGKDSLFGRLYPKNQLVETHFSYEQNLKEIAVVQLLKEEEIAGFQKESKDFWNTDYDGDFLEYRQK